MPKVTDTHHRSPRQAQIDCSRQWIVGAYSQLITTMPDDKITISAICSTAGVGRQTFYRHFRNKKDVFTYQMNHGYELYAEQIRQLPRDSLTMETLLVEAFEFWKKYQTVLNPLAQSKDLNHWFMEMFTRVWRRIAREFLPASTSSQYDIEFQIAGINGVFLHWLKRDMKESPADIAKMIVNLLDSHAFSQDSQL
jgi:AcrR family transcriptional regulator